ncbi:hypothetical protein TKK_0013487 [Trichogramma kaykai]
MSKEEAAQMFFHSTLGTHKDDLGILSKIANVGTWKASNEFSKNAFLRGGTSTTEVEFQAPNFFIPTFSRQQTRHFKPSFFLMIGGGTNSFITNRSISNIVMLYYNMAMKFADIIENKGRQQQVGTVKWRSMDQLTFSAQDDVVPDLVVEGCGKLYIGDEVESMMS